MLTRVFLFLVALAFVLIGINTFVQPVQAVAALDWVPTSATALNEVRANYGGLQLALGFLTAWGLFKAERVDVSLWVVFCVTAGLVFGRLYSIVADGKPSETLFMFLAIESACAGLALLLLRQRR